MAWLHYTLFFLSLSWALAAPTYVDPNYAAMKALDLLPPSNANIQRAFVLAATGTQNYMCSKNTTSGTMSFTLKEPIAQLSYVQGAQMGRHFFRTDQAGGMATWETECGSSFVTSKKIKGVSSPSGNTTAIDWLLTQRTSSSAQGVFSNITFVARIHTKGGVKPSDTQCTQEGQIVPVPYKARYVFFS